jgi:biopolymer transport protein ExbB/biopolymer transport protein TolQ
METTTFGPVEIWNSMGGVGHAVLGFLLLMSIYSIWVMVERAIVFRKARAQSLLFVESAKPLLVNGEIENLLAETKKYPKSHLAHIFAAAIVDWMDYRHNPEPPVGFEATMGRAIEREGVLVTQELKRGLSGLASIGATAPFVGLFGTVVGIMNAFFSMARAGQGGIGTVAGGIAEALVNTAVGLFVALPAVWGFNYFLNRIERFKVEMTNSGTELVDYFIKRTRSEMWKSATRNP